MPLLVISIIVQLALVVHIIKTGRNTTWVFIVLFFPLIGTLAYFIIELLPELTNTNAAKSAQRSIAHAVDPDKAMREATEQYALARTAQNALALAELHLAKGNFAEAKELFQRSLSGVHSDDPDLLLGLAHAHFGLAEFAETLRALDDFKRANQGKTSQDGHLLYARALEESGRIDEAMDEYRALADYSAGPEASCRLAMLLQAQGRADEARALYESVVARSKTAGKHYNNLYQKWVAQARREAQA
ncbi:MAG: tetratricopeptide repeat protein [Gammaproteobacteria bacterium]|nr:tetratricopeptide repeat protein [Gammaproteobacteria bacterium]